MSGTLAIDPVNILAIDTTSEFGSVAVRAGGATVAQVEVHAASGFGHVIFGEIEEALRRAGMGLDTIECFAAGSGPGSFTGVRVGLAAVKGLAEATGRRAAGVSNLQALASLGELPLRAVVLDARRGEVYAAVYDAALSAVMEECVMPMAAWLERLDAAEYEFVGDGGLRGALAGTRFEAMRWTDAPKELAGAIARCAEMTGGGDAAALDANYVRRSDAELFWRDG